MNQAEIEHMAAQFRAAGHTILDSVENADLVIVNSCAVTAEAASDSRQKVRQAYRAGVPRIIYTGCMATIDPTAGLNLPGVSQVVPNDLKNDIAASVIGGQEIFDLEPLARQPLPGIHKRTRAFIKVQDGCDNFCTYCVTRIARGKGKSVEAEEVLKEIHFAEAGGANEIVLTGVNLGSWGRDLVEKKNLTWLIRFLIKESNIKRIRLSSIEPWDLGEDFFALWQEKRMCRHLHLPLQSGSAGVLHRMVRNTTPQKYLDLVNTARKMIPGLAITTDIIVGFPGETEEEFNESLDFVKAIGFSDGHIFKYSARPGTAAARMPGRIHGSTAAERSKRMRLAVEESSRQFTESFVGKELEVLWETSRKSSENSWLLHGLSDNYLQIQSKSSEDCSNKINSIKITNINGNIAEAEIVD